MNLKLSIEYCYKSLQISRHPQTHQFLHEKFTIASITVIDEVIYYKHGFEYANINDMFFFQENQVIVYKYLRYLG